MQATSNQAAASTGPWWKFGHMWLVLGGPAVVVVAGIATVIIAARGADPIVDPNYSQTGAALSSHQVDKRYAPANTVRNHATTPQADLPNLAPK